jgi:transmembrane sensor
MICLVAVNRYDCIMPDNKKFTYLLNTYLSGEATNEQYQQLMYLVKSGNYDELVKQQIDDALWNSSDKVSFEEDRAKKLLYSILNSEKQTAALIKEHKPARNIWWWAAAAFIAVLVVVTQLFTGKKSTVSITKTNTILQPTANHNNQKYIRLQDGSTVLLNEGSKLEYPDSFKNTTREVTLVGEGYFDIQHDASRPFIVHTGKVSTTVLGTAFNIKAYPGQKEITITVTRGKVKVGDDRKTLGIITPNESIAVNTESRIYHQEKVNAEAVVEWKKQYLVFDNISMEDAAVLINSRYHVNISFAKPSLKDCRISATFLNNESLEQVLTVVTSVVNAHYSAQPNDQIIISGEGCK